MVDLSIGLASQYLQQEKKCQLVLFFTPVRKGRQLLVPKMRAKPLSRPLEVIELRASSEPVDCSLQGPAFEVLARLLRSYRSIAEDFLALQRPNSTLQSFQEAALRGPRNERGFRNARLEVELQLAHGNVVRLFYYRESPIRGEPYTELLGIRLQDSQGSRHAVDLLEDGYTEEEQIEHFGDQSAAAAHILGVMRASRRPWAGRYSCTFKTNGFVVLSALGSVTCRFEKIYSAVSAVSSVNRGTRKSMEEFTRKRKRPPEE